MLDGSCGRWRTAETKTGYGTNSMPLCLSMLAESPLGLHTYISSSWNQYLNSDDFDDDNTGSSASISGSHPTVAERGEQR